MESGKLNVERYRFPPLYGSWITQLIGDLVPDETRATCMDCAMCKPREPSAAKDRIFHSSTKCCTYIPILPNFLVGGILLDEDPAFAEGKALFESRAPGLSVSPSGIEAPWHFWWHYYDKPFGQTEFLRCPYYIDRNGGLCGIWKYRNSRCTTWFCKYNRGVFGLHFWNSLSELLARIEKALSEWCMRTLDLSLPDWAEEPVRRVWGNWAGREGEFYKECFHLVRNLTWQQVLGIAGHEAMEHAQETLNVFQAITDDSIPAKLEAGSFHFEELGVDIVRVWGYGSYDSVDLPRSILEQIRHFDGEASNLDPSLIRRLYELGILIPAHSISNGLP